MIHPIFCTPMPLNPFTLHPQWPLGVKASNFLETLMIFAAKRLSTYSEKVYNIVSSSVVTKGTILATFVYFFAICTP